MRQSFGDNQVQLAEPHLSGPDDRQQHQHVRHAQVQEEAAADCVLERKRLRRPHDRQRRRRSSAIPTRSGSGDRTGNITVTLGGVTAGGGSASQLVNGSTANEFWWNSGSAATLKFDLGTAKVIKQARWKQSNSSTHGTFKWQGSNDDTTYTDIGGTFTLGGATVQIHTTPDR